jgi:GNAT superfamily N-acetyltransferase
MRVLLLDSSLEPLFWEHVNQDVPNYFFFILDMKQDRASTKVRLALDEQNNIEGMMLVYVDRIVQLRGSVDSARVLLDEIDIKNVEIQGLPKHKTLILKKYRNIKKDSEIVLMTLRRGEEKLQTMHHTAPLTADDAEDIATLMRHGKPDWWGEVTAERIAARMKKRLWLGIRVDGRLVSIGGAMIDALGSHIATVVSHERYRNRGYATFVVSALVEQILQKSDIALIHVESDNQPAMSVNTKVGFKPYRNYFLARAQK